jgi:cholesterol transport system auxiliary component
MKLIHRRALLLATPLLASACSVLPERPYQEISRYALEPRRQGDGWRGKGRRLLLVRTVRAPAALDVRGLRSIRPDGTEEIDFYAEWISPPAEAAEQALRRWLMDARLFAAVLAPGSRANPDLVLEGELTRLVANRARGQAEAELNFVLISEREASPRVLGQMISSGTAALPSGALRPDQAAAAMSAALGNALGSLEQALARYA